MMNALKKLVPLGRNYPAPIQKRFLKVYTTYKCPSCNCNKMLYSHTQDTTWDDDKIPFFSGMGLTIYIFAMYKLLNPVETK